MGGGCLLTIYLLQGKTLREGSETTQDLTESFLIGAHPLKMLSGEGMHLNCRDKFVILRIVRGQKSYEVYRNFLLEGK